MAVITIEDVPESVINRIWAKVYFSQINISKKRIYQKKDPTVKLNKIVNDPDNLNYGPFDRVDDAIDFLNRDLWK